MAELKSIPGGKASSPRRKPAAPKPPAAPRRMTTAQALVKGTPLQKLEALRDLAGKRLADPKTSARDFGTILKQFTDLEEKIAAAQGGGASKPEGSASSEPDLDDEPWDGDDF